MPANAMQQSAATQMEKEVASRIMALRLDSGYSQEQMADMTGFDLVDYAAYESGSADLPFSFIHKCASVFDVEIMELLEGKTPLLTGYTLTRSGGGQLTSVEPGIVIKNVAHLFKDRIADPYYVVYNYNEAQQHEPIEQVTHPGQEFDYVLEGSMKIKIKDNEEVLHAGDSIFYNSGNPHGIIAVGGKDVRFLAIVLPEEGADLKWEHGRLISKEAPAAIRKEVSPDALKAPNFVSNFVTVKEREDGYPEEVTFKNTDRFNFAFDVVDAIAEKEPNRLCMVHLDRNKVERRFTFQDMKKMSARAANYFKAHGIKKGDAVMLILRRNWEFWPIIIGLHKLGAIAIPATDQLKQKDLEYRFQTANVKAVCCCALSACAEEVENSLPACPSVKELFVTEGSREGWHCFDDEYDMYSSRYRFTGDSIRGNDTMLMLFSSGTSGYPKAVTHSCKYALGHFVTARYWHCVHADGLHLTISDTGWGKALWGKLYGQWMNGGATFVYDFDRFHADDILPLFAKYHITTFCAPPTMYRYFIKEDLSKYDLSSIRHASIAGEAMNPEVFTRFREATGISIMEGFGQTETTLTVGNFIGMTPKPGSMGKPSPMYTVMLMTADGKEANVGEPGEVCIKVAGGEPCGLFKGYLNNPEATAAVKNGGWYHTGDLAWKDEDGYFWYVGRTDDIIKSSGYRIGPFEI
ncbi:MAG: AMP-binding protein, partial [Lachnospiraceae bacterium]|nr:AMP-binding protein [Lachnospiraceae bacterium]